MSEIFIRRPKATILLSIGMLLIGLVVLNRIGIAAMPSVTAPVIMVSASLSGADADTVAKTLAAPLERRLGQIPGIDDMRSTSREGSTRITLQFAFSRDVDSAARDVQAAINVATPDLPDGMKSPPSFRKFNPSQAPILVFAMTSTTMTGSDVYDLADTDVVPALSQLQGVGDVSVSGAEKRAIRIQVDPAVLAGLDLAFDDLRTAIAGANSLSPRGEVHGPRLAYEFTVNAQSNSIEDYANIVIANRKRTPVRLGDIATIVEAPADARNAARFNGKPSVLVSVSRLPDANIVETSDRVYEAVEKLRGWMPAGVTIEVQREQTSMIRATVNHVGVILSVTIVLAVAVVALFLRRASATLIPALAIPSALAGTLACIDQMGFTLNTMSLMALTVAIGFIVDDAIVVVDAVAHRRDLGEGRLAAAINGARQIGFTIISMSVSLAAAFIPLLFMDDFLGRVMAEFSLTVVAAIGVSAVVALTLTPTLCGGLISRREGDGSRRGFVVDRYVRALTFALRHKVLSLLVVFACVYLIGPVGSSVPQGLFPRQDTGALSCWIDGSPDIAFKAMDERTRAVENTLRADPAIKSISAAVSTGRSASINITLKPVEERADTPDQVVARLRPKLEAIPGVVATLIVEQDTRGGPRPDRAEYQYTLTGDDFDELTEWTRVLVEKFKEKSAVADVGSDLDNRGSEARLAVDREAASRLGVTMSQIDNALNDAFGQRQITNILTNRDQFPVILEATPDLGRDPERLRDVYIRKSNGDQIPLSSIARLEFGDSAPSINHKGGLASVSISFNIAPGKALSDVTAAVREVEASVTLPETVRGELAGDARTFQRGQQQQLGLVLIAVIAIYIILGVLYESAIHPITIISTLPPGCLGALIALSATQTQFSIVAMVGLILVVGMVMKNAIILVDYAQEARRVRGIDPQTAILEAARLRFRPILMTTIAATVGALVLAIDNGVGSELRRPMGVAMTGGLLFAQLVTMFSAPVVYVWMSGAWITGVKTRVRRILGVLRRRPRAGQ